jgi:magnesium-transporting ATPase (P-type)
MTPSHSQDGNGSYRLFATKTILNYGNDDEVECIGYKKDRLKSLFTHIVSILLVGIPYLIGYWKPAWKVKWHRSVSPLFNADTVLLREKTLGDAQIVPISIKHVSEHFIPRYIHKSDLNCDSSSSGGSTEASSLSSSEDTSPLWHPSKLTLRYFVHHHSKYVWDSKKKTYVRLYGLDRDTQLNMFSADLSRGLTRDMQMVRQMLYGPNSIEVEVKPYLKLLFEEVLNPFYIFQIASMILWSLDNYYYYASCILFISVVSVVVSLLETRRQSQSLHDMVASSNELMATVYRGQDIFEDLQSTELVPGDVIAIPSSGCVMSCDAVLVAGTCIVNESMLTGESVPVTKSSIPMTDINDEENEEYDPERHKRHTLFSGTAVIQTRYYGQSHVLAVVVRTGFDTAKGALIRSILYPRPMGFKFYRDSIRYTCCHVKLTF